MSLLKKTTTKKTHKEDILGPSVSAQYCVSADALNRGVGIGFIRERDKYGFKFPLWKSICASNGEAAVASYCTT